MTCSLSALRRKTLTLTHYTLRPSAPVFLSFRGASAFLPTLQTRYFYEYLRAINPEKLEGKRVLLAANVA